MYDKDGSGSIDLPEMIEIIGTLYEMEGVAKVCVNNVKLGFLAVTVVFVNMLAKSKDF
jgi:hypothetical protein